MNIGRFRFAAVSLCLALTLASPTSFAANDSFVGTWVLNPAKSTFPPVGQPDAITTVLSDAGGGMYKSVTDTTIAGQTIHGEITFALDGKEYKAVMTPAPPGATIAQSFEGVNAMTYKTSLKMNGELISETLNEVSPDGKTLTVKSTGMGAAAGVSAVMVFDRK